MLSQTLTYSKLKSRKLNFTAYYFTGLVLYIFRTRLRKRKHLEALINNDSLLSVLIFEPITFIGNSVVCSTFFFHFYF